LARHQTPFVGSDLGATGHTGNRQHGRGRQHGRDGTPSTVGQVTCTAQLVGDVVRERSFKDAVIQIRNFASAAAVTVTPLPGGTQARAAVLVIEQLF